jgi:hypothetical protein
MKHTKTQTKLIMIVTLLRMVTENQEFRRCVLEGRESVDGDRLSRGLWPNVASPIVGQLGNQSLLSRHLEGKYFGTKSISENGISSCQTICTGDVCCVLQEDIEEFQIVVLEADLGCGRMQRECYLKQETSSQVDRKHPVGLIFDVFLGVSSGAEFHSDVLITPSMLSPWFSGFAHLIPRYFDVNLFVFPIGRAPVGLWRFERASEDVASDNKVGTNTSPSK